jgi:DNA topoisomerase IA
MPQFDIFSFFSQLFWVFFGFITLYLLLSFYLLPALAVTLKIRKRKLAQTSVNSTSSNLIDNNNPVSDATKSLVSDFSSKILTVESVTSSSQTNLTSKLNLLTLQTEASRQFNFSVVSQAQLSAIFFK